MSKIKDLWNKYREPIVYLFFGVLTTLVDTIVYFLCNNLWRINATWSTVISQFVAMTFAYITNKLWVFESKTHTPKEFLREIGSFYGCRIAGAVFSVLVARYLVEKPGWETADWAVLTLFGREIKWYSLLIKVLTSVIVIIANYIASKLLIFRKKKQNDSK
ncbi:MAG: GtrA family protein [Christensenellaceae bacterium]